MNDDAAVIAASLETPASFGTIFDRHATAIHRYLVRRVGPEAAEGLLGECFRIAFERRATYDTDHRIARPWLYGIATNLVAAHRRAEGRRYRILERMAQERDKRTPIASSVTGDVVSRQRLRRVLKAIGELPEAERDALLLFVWEELSYDEVASALSVPVGTVRSRIHRARARLRGLDELTTEPLHEKGTSR